MTGRDDSPLDAIVLSEKDNVATALRALQAGEVALVETPSSRIEIAITEPIARCHKFAITTIDPAQHIYKYGEVIGIATQATQAGAHVHVHNIKSLRAGAR